MRAFTRGQLAHKSKVGAEAIRFYERQGLLPPTARSDNGYRRYTEDAVQRLNFIRRAKTLGFNLKEIKELLSLHDSPNASRSEVKAMTQNKLIEIEQRILDLQRIRKVLARLDTECSGQGPIRGCPIIQTLDDGDPAAAIAVDQE